jgi:AcrR family transcriptional regulator
MNAPRSARERVRAQLATEIKDTARAQLARDGAAGLSLRAVARQLGMASSAVYRYFTSRDELLTALIVDAYDALGAAAERADAAADRDDHAGRWLALCHGIRDWALRHPHEYALIYGSPVPGYRAPQDTVPAATRVAAALGAIVRDAAAAGALAAPGPAPTTAQPASMATDAQRLRTAVMPGVPDDAVARSLLAWMALFGIVSFELFGHLNNVVNDYAAAFDHQARELAHYVGLRPARPE